MHNLHFKKSIRFGSFNKSERHYFDYIISGHPLLDLLEINDSDLVTPFGWFENKEYAQRLKQILTFQQKPDLATGRVMLYVCPECGDIDCGAITATIVDSGDRIQWKDFGYETGYEGISKVYSTPYPIEFARQDYLDAFSQLP